MDSNEIKENLYQIRFMANDCLHEMEGDYSLNSDGSLEEVDLEDYMARMKCVLSLIDNEISRITTGEVAE